MILKIYFYSFFFFLNNNIIFYYKIKYCFIVKKKKLFLKIHISMNVLFFFSFVTCIIHIIKVYPNHYQYIWVKLLLIYYF